MHNFYVEINLFLISLTIHVSPVINDHKQAGTIADVPHSYRAVPASGHQEVGHFIVPRQTSHRTGVTRQLADTLLLSVVPHPHRAVKGKMQLN